VEPQPPQAIEVFYSYAREDESLRDELRKHLAILRRQGVITDWYDRDIALGQEWDEEIKGHLDSASVILLLVSPDFVNSDYCNDVEVKRAMERHDAGEACVIPVVLRPINWKGAPFGKLQGLPTDAKPVTSWENRDEAFVIVSEGIQRAVEALLIKRRAQEAAAGKPRAGAVIPRRPVIGFVARRDEAGQDIVGQLKERLVPYSNNLVTLSGAGGIGKTTLAAETARAWGATFQERIVWSSADGRPDFALYTLLDDILTQLGRADLRTLAPELKETQVGALVAEPQTLVILDNYETIATEARQKIERWFEQAQCPALFTSRHKIPATQNISIAAMSREEARDYLERLAGQAVEPHIFTGEVRQGIYETAEANPYVMQWVVAQIDEAKEPLTVFQELSQGEGDAAQRVFDRSFKLPQLGDDGRSTLLALSLFTPSASRRALATVAGFADDPKRIDEPLKNLRALSLIKGLNQHSRFTIEGLTRSLAGARLSKDERAAEFKERFIKYFRSYSVEHKHRTPEDYDTLEAEKDNLLKAIDMYLDSGDLESANVMTNILAAPESGMLSVRGYWDDAIQYQEQALQASRNAQSEPVIAHFAHCVAMMYQRRGNSAKARRLYDESLEISKKLNGEVNMAATLHQLGRLAHDQGDLEEARRLYDESLEINKKLDNQSGMSSTLHQLGMLAEDQGDLEDARRLYGESLEVVKKLGDQGTIASTLHQLGRLAQEQGDLKEARRLYDESLVIKKKLGNQNGIALTLGQLGMLTEEQGDLVEAERLMSEALSIFERLNSPYADIARAELERIRGKM
jgi:tetratricopeptide (TPR) repeat protein